jgi:hypothetical protein
VNALTELALLTGENIFVPVPIATEVVDVNVS